MKIRLFTALLVIILLSGCKKDPSLECNPLPISNSPFGWNYTFDPIEYAAPCFNPNNSNELSFIQNAGGASILYTYNIQTKVILPLFRGNIFYKPDWGRSNWILFDANNIVYKIKSNGDSLTELTFGGSANYPEWNPTANEITFNYVDLGTGVNVIANDNGVIIDTLPLSYLTNPPWSDSIMVGNEVSTSGYLSFVVYNFNTKASTVIPTSSAGGYSGECFVSSTEFIWADAGGIYVTNIETSQTLKIKENCGAITYLFPSYSSISNKVLWNKIIETPSGSNTLHVSSIIVMMNPDGSDEQEVNLP